MVFTAASGVLLAAALWSVGRFFVLPPAAMAVLLSATVLQGVLALVTARTAAPRRRCLGRLSGFLALGAAAAFLGRLFFVGVDDVERTRRVAEPAVRITRLRLVDFNVLHGYPSFRGQKERYGRLRAALQTLDATVIVLQEAWWVAGYGQLVERLASELGLDAAYARANGSRNLLGFEEGSAVLSRLPIMRASRLVLRPRWPPWEARIALDVELAVGPDETLRLVATHLAAGNEEVAAAQAQDLLRQLGAHSLLVVGDLNAPSGSATVSAFTERGYDDVVPGGIDHVLMRQTPAWRLVRAGWTLRSKDLESLIGEAVTISDHPGILVELERITSPLGLPTWVRPQSKRP